MRKVHVIGLVLFAVFAFSALATASASAGPRLLNSGTEIKALLEAEMTGELLLEDSSVKAGVTCSGIFDIDIEPPGELFFITRMLMLTKELLSEAVEVLLGSSQEGDMLECEPDSGSPCGEETLVTVINLPWNVNILLVTVGGVNLYFADILPNASGDEPGYVVDCNAIIGLIEDMCTNESTTTETTFGLFNEAGGLLGEFTSANKAEGGITEPGICSTGGAKSGLLNGDFLFTVGLTVSE